MTDWRVPLADVALEESDIEAVADTYRSGWLSLGPRTEELEQRFADYTGASHAIATSSCTAALHLSCLAAGLGAGDEVIVPSLTFVATVNAIRYTGATPVFADVVSLERPWMDPADVARKVGDRTRAVMSMSYGGNPGGLLELARIAEDSGLLLLEDAAHALGSRVDVRSVGTLGAAGSYSFFSNKNAPIGEGGMLVTGDDGVAERARLLRSHGMTSLSWDRHRGHAFGYDVVALGFNYRIDEPRATLAMRQLARLDERNARRDALVAAYADALSEADALTPALPAEPGCASAHHLMTVCVAEGVDRDAVRKAMAEAGVQTSLHYPPVHGFSIYEREGVSLPVTEEYALRAITLPLFPQMTMEQLEIVVVELLAAVDAAGA